MTKGWGRSRRRPPFVVPGTEVRGCEVRECESDRSPRIPIGRPPSAAAVRLRCRRRCRQAVILRPGRANRPPRGCPQGRRIYPAKSEARARQRRRCRARPPGPSDRGTARPGGITASSSPNRLVDFPPRGRSRSADSPPGRVAASSSPDRLVDFPPHDRSRSAGSPPGRIAGLSSPNRPVDFRRAIDRVRLEEHLRPSNRTVPADRIVRALRASSRLAIRTHSRCLDPPDGQRFGSSDEQRGPPREVRGGPRLHASEPATWGQETSTPSV